MNAYAKIGRHRIEFSSLDKILFPHDKLTKKDLLSYYMYVAPLMVLYCRNRWLSMQRWPDGIQKEGFFQKNAQDYFPGWIKRIKVAKQEGGVTNYVVGNNAATFIYLANHGCITFHVALSKIDKINYPDRMIFDLDPSGDDDFESVVMLAFALKKIVEKDNLTPFVMTTGSRGVHVVVPIKRRYPFEYVEHIAQIYGRILIEKYPQKATLAFYKKARKNRVFIDTLRNQYGATAVCPYSIRARQGAPVAMPITWKELETISSANHFKMVGAMDYINNRKDPWSLLKKKAGFLPRVDSTIKFIEYPKLWL